jgi:flavin reductase (DIM6/NTAB) family NADH-FMN oxidoreductase RutF
MTNAPEHSEQHRTAFISAMRGVGASVTVVTTNGKAGRRGATVSAFCSVSADPPTILVCLNGSSGIADAVAENGRFNVNILRADQEAIARRFAGHDDGHVTDRFDNIDCDASDIPEITGSMILCCETQSLVPSTSHTIVIARVYTVKHPHLVPLAYLNGDFHQLVRTKANSE